MENCPHCDGRGANPRACGCGIFPKENEPLQPCPVCNWYRWTGCHTCDRTGEVTPLKYRRLTMAEEEFEEYENRKNPIKKT